jgi:DnaJ-class molecular chaperone
MARFGLLAVLLTLPLLLGCESMVREMNANKEWETCHNPSCTLCGGTGAIACDACTPQGETQCGNCNGTGMADIPTTAQCAQCQGQGFVFTASGAQVQCSACQGTGQKTVYEKKQCPVCGGRGWATCPDCGGDKQMSHGRWVKVYQDGQRVARQWETIP